MFLSQVWPVGLNRSHLKIWFAFTQLNIINQTRLLIQLLWCKYYANFSLSHFLSLLSTSRHEASPPCPICKEMSDILASCCAPFSEAYRSLISSDRAFPVLAVSSWGMKSNQSIEVWCKNKPLWPSSDIIYTEQVVDRKSLVHLVLCEVWMSGENI